MEHIPANNEDLYISQRISFRITILWRYDSDVPYDEDIWWIKYLQRLREGAWGDHLVMWISGMLNVNIKIIFIQTAIGKTISGICNIYLGLIDQFHYKKFTYECRKQT